MVRYVFIVAVNTGRRVLGIQSNFEAAVDDFCRPFFCQSLRCRYVFHDVVLKVIPAIDRSERSGHHRQQPDFFGHQLLSGQWRQLIRAGTQQISQILTAISDAVTVRLIQIAEEKLGPAPVAWCWLGFGSQARAEQLLGADQDNGIIIDDSVEAEQLPWYEQMAELVCDGLNACGYVYCPGEVMASTDEWRQPLSHPWLTIGERSAIKSPPSSNG